MNNVIEKNPVATYSPPPPDVLVENHGSIFLFRPITDAAREVFAEKLADAQRLGRAVVCEHRYARDLAENLRDIDGLVLA